MPAVPSPDIESMSYEQARDELARVVAILEQGDVTLEDSLALWELGEKLASRCENFLVGARARLESARARADGSGASDGTGTTGQDDL